MRCEECRNYAQELFPGKMEGEVKQLCIHCVPKCEFDGACKEPVDIRCEFLCTACEIAVCKWSLERCDDPDDAKDYEATIAELSGRTQFQEAA